MNTSKKVILTGTGVALALSATTGAAFASASPAEPTDFDTLAAATAAAQVDVQQIVREAAVNGQFSFSQAIVATNEELRKVILGASKYLCGASSAGLTEGAVPAEEWKITVDGLVGESYVATLQDIRDSAESKTTIMGCACAGNPADGNANANAEVTGTSIMDMINKAAPMEQANTVVITSADGYEVALPLRYLAMHYCPLVYAVNGSPLVESVGGTNQLWLGATSASYFARDVVSITLEERETLPADPTSDEARASYANLPNIGVRFGGEVA